MSIVYQFMYWLIDWFFDLHTQSDNRSVSLSMVVENKRRMIEWVILLYQIRSSSVLRRVMEWKSLNRLSIIHSITQIFHCNSQYWSTLLITLFCQHQWFHLMYNIFLITVHTHFKTIFAGLLIHFQLWMTEIESDVDITTNHIPIHSHSFSYNFLYHNQI